MIIKKRYFSWCVILNIVAISAVAVAQDRPAADVRDAKESDLIAVLQSDAPKGDKAITCKQLAIYGTERNWRRGRASRWKRFPDRPPMRLCAMRWAR